MAKLTQADAARQLGISRTTLYKLIDQGKLSATPDGLIDQAELVRIAPLLDVHRERTRTPLDIEPVDTYPSHSERGERPVDSLSGHYEQGPDERQLTSTYRDVVDILRAQLQAAQERERDYREHVARLTAMLHEAHQQNQRLLDMPRSPPAPLPAPRAPAAPEAPRWLPCRPHFFLPVKVLSRRFRHLFLDALGHAYTQGDLTFAGGCRPLASLPAWHHFLASLHTTEWVVYAKEPLRTPRHVLAYLARYTHRVAISNQRLLALENGQVTFRYKDYQRGHRLRTRTLDAVEFLRRFLLHVLPRAFQRIGHFGFLANRVRQAKLAVYRALLPQQTAIPPLRRVDAEPPPAQAASGTVCPACQRGQMYWVETLQSQPALCAKDVQPSSWDISSQDMAINRRPPLLQRPSCRGSALHRATYALGTLWARACCARQAWPAPSWCWSLYNALCVWSSRNGLTPPTE